MLATLLKPDGGSARVLRPRRRQGGRDRPRPHRRHRPVRLRRRDALRHREPRRLRPAARPVAQAGEGQGDRAARAVLAHGGGQAPAEEVLRRHAAPARPRREPHRAAAADLPRRADHGSRPAHPRADVGHHPRARHDRLHRAAHHPVPRRGRPARRPHRGHRPRPGRRGGHLGRPEGLRRHRHPAAAARRPGRPRGRGGADPQRASACSPSPPPSARWLTVPLQDPERVTDLLVDLRDAGIRLAEFGVQKPTLDEVFLAITGHGADDSRPTAEKDEVLRMTAVASIAAAAAAQRRHPHRQPVADDGLPRPAQGPPHPRAAVRRDAAADHLHGDVRLHLRRRDRRQRADLPARADPRHPRADRHHRVGRHRRPAARGHGQGRVRPVPVPADRPHRAARRGAARRHRALRDRDDDHVRGRRDHGLPPDRRPPRLDDRWPACS